MESNPYSSPNDVESNSGAAGRSSPWKRVVAIAYLLVFCVLHAVAVYLNVQAMREQGRISVLHSLGTAIPVLAAICAWRYAMDDQPTRNLRFWQAAPFLVFMYAVMSVRAVFEGAGGALVSVEAVVVAGVGLLVYGPAIYMSYQLTGSLVPWETPEGRK